ncbi:MAG TPA: PPOX class F420-dependent oxidoreductase [Acidimicrobiales bacterium]|nr:PPOX class F420-dependent oxidoreductase [Acidimicrobiales bacterium]
MKSVTEPATPAEMSERVVALLRSKAFATIATLMPDGAPHATETWIDTDGTHVLLNTVVGYQKLRNIERDGRVALVVSNPDDPARHVAIRGQVTSTSGEGAKEHIESLSARYFGTPYPFHHLGQRIIVRIAPTRIIDSLERR